MAVAEASEFATDASFVRAVSLLASAQAVRHVSPALLPASEADRQVRQMVGKAAEELASWAVHWTSPEQAVLILRDWPLIQLLADLEVPQTVHVAAVANLPDYYGEQLLHFRPATDIAIAVKPHRETMSDHNRLMGRFHCMPNFYLEVEDWANKYFNDITKRFVVVEVGCSILDCLIWAAIRLRGRIRAVCFEAERQAVLVGQQSLRLNGLEGLVDVIHRAITNSPESMQFACREHYLPSDRESVDFEDVPWYRRCAMVEKEVVAQQDFTGQGMRWMPVPGVRTSGLDAEMVRLGLGPLDLLKLTFSSPDIMRSAETTLASCTRALLTTYPRDFDEQLALLPTAGFTYIGHPDFDSAPAYGWEIHCRRPFP